LPLLLGAGEVVQGLGSHWPLGLASSSPRLLIDAVLESARLTRWFSVTVSTEEVEAGKPSPAVYREAVRRLGVDAQRTVAVEDSSNGLRSAARAGLAVIAVPNAAFLPAEDALALAAAVVHSLDEISPELVASLPRSPAAAETGHPDLPGRSQSARAPHDCRAQDRPAGIRGTGGAPG
jgi:beta-phosphoglucomutase-like phosphatase (HAD superfamily)